MIHFCVFLLLAHGAYANWYTYNAMTCDARTVLYENQGSSSGTQTCSPGEISGQTKRRTNTIDPFLTEWNLHSYSDVTYYSFDNTCGTPSSKTRLRLNDIQYYTVLGNMIPRCTDTTFYLEDQLGNKRSETLINTCVVTGTSGATSEFRTCYQNPNATKVPLSADTTTSNGSKFKSMGSLLYVFSLLFVYFDVA
jgi:hypothetical protein